MAAKLTVVQWPRVYRVTQQPSTLLRRSPPVHGSARTRDGYDQTNNMNDDSRNNSGAHNAPSNPSDGGRRRRGDGPLRPGSESGRTGEVPFILPGQVLSQDDDIFSSVPQDDAASQKLFGIPVNDLAASVGGQSGGGGAGVLASHRG